MKKKSNFNLRTIFIDGILLIVLIIFVLVEKFYLLNILNRCFYKNLPSISVFVEILLPTTITIISISLSLSKEKIYGATLNEINRIRGPWHYSFLHSSITMCSIILLYAILNVINAKISIYLLSLISFIYCVYFLIQEIPILTRSGKVIAHILKKHYKKRSKSIKLMSQFDEQIYHDIVLNIIITEGMETAYNTLSKEQKDSEILEFLLDIQNQYLKKMNEENSLQNFLILKSNQDFDVVSNIEICYQNVTQLLSDNNFNYSNIIGQNKYFYLTRSLFYLHEVCTKNGMNNIEKRHIDIIIYDYITAYFGSKKYVYSESVILAMCVTTIKDGELWFIKYLRDNLVFSGSIFGFENCCIGIFITMIINHMIKKNTINEGLKTKIVKFLKEDCNGINTNGYNWLKNIQYSIGLTNTQIVAESLNKFLNLFKCVDCNEFRLRVNNKNYIYNYLDNFNECDVIDQWIEILILSYVQKGNNFELKNIVENLCDEDKSILMNVLSEKWIRKGKFFIKNDLTFGRLIYSNDNEMILKDKAIYENIFNEFVIFHDNVAKKAVGAKLEENGIKDYLNDKILNSTLKSIKESPFYYNDLSMTNYEEKYFRFILKDFNRESCVDSILGQIPLCLIKMIIDKIKNNSKIIKIDNFKFTDDQILEIIKLKPDYTTNNWWLSFCSDKSKYYSEIKKLEINDFKNFGLNIFFKENSIKFNAEIINNKPLIRNLNILEVENIINNKYQLYPNGFYRYSEYDNDDKNSFFLTKKELEELLTKQYAYVEISLKIKIEIKKDSCFVIEYK